MGVDRVDEAEKANGQQRQEKLFIHKEGSLHFFLAIQSIVASPLPAHPTSNSNRMNCREAKLISSDFAGFKNSYRNAFAPSIAFIAENIEEITGPYVVCTNRRNPVDWAKTVSPKAVSEYEKLEGAFPFGI